MNGLVGRVSVKTRLSRKLYSDMISVRTPNKINCVDISMAQRKSVASPLLTYQIYPAVLLLST